MAADVLLLALGLTLLLGGGEMVVRGSAGLARSLGVSPLAIGLTLVAFGTSAPELAVNLTAAVRGRTDICFGNVIGSNMANIGLIVGCMALVRPFPMRGVVVAREIPMMLLATGAALVMGFDVATGGGEDRFGRTDGVVLMMFFLVFLYYTVGDFVRQRVRYHVGLGVSGARAAATSEGIRRGLLLTAFGLAGLVGGAQVSVDAAVDLARALGVSEAVIGVTVLAIGTSLPELVASLVATARNHPDLAIGNVVGSNIFNLLLVAGFTAAIRPIPVPDGGHLDLLAMAFLSALLYAASFTRTRMIVRGEGAALLVVYIGYVAWRTVGSQGT